MHKGLLLLSGGIDSPVAGYLAKEAGTELYAIHFSAEKIVGNEPLKKSIEACKILGIKKIFVADISEELVELTKKCEIRYYFLLTYPHLPSRLNCFRPDASPIVFIIVSSSVAMMA